MNEFTIKDIENLSGIKAHTWRIWEQRYGIGVAQRRESKHRFFDTENLKQILRISYLYNNGFKISKIAALRPDELNEMTLTKLAKENENDFYVKELIESSIDLNEERFEETFNEVLEKMGIESAILNVINPFQERIGVLWLTDHIIPAQEHFTSNIIRQKLTKAIDDLPLVKTTAKKEIVLFTPERERHEIPLQFIHYLLKKNKNRVIYFGSNASLKSIEIYQENHSFTYLHFHLITNLAGISPDEYLQKISYAFPGKQIIMSGVQVYQVTKIPGNVRLLKSMKEVVEFTYE
ncbi:MerR family transcriptional regulator [Segetibacter koreensis]|uniref:MerR family transcriptional regulator n=1 Tax=Segetibacter koreensis TaxID=398037 RepID=UPI0003763071|nr:MerR family transcriptional regulator [Segetibacter koreensis]